MKMVTNLMINEFKLRELGMDMMGYKVVRDNEYSFHHLIVPHRDCKRKKIESDGYVRWNGAILSSKSAHPYLHLVEQYKRAYFEDITHQLINMNQKGYVDVEDLRIIHDLLGEFELLYDYEVSHKGKLLIKPEYRNRIVLNDENCEKIENVKKKILTRNINDDIL